MQTVIRIAAALAAAGLGYWLTQAVVGRRPRYRVALMIVCAIAWAVEVFLLDVEPLSEASTVRQTGYVLPFWHAMLALMLHFALLGGLLGSAGARRKEGA